MKASKFRWLIGLLVVIFLLSGLGIVAGVLGVWHTHYEFTAKFPDAKTMNISTDVPFNDVSTRSLVSLAACITNGITPRRQGDEPPYVDGRLVSIHVVSSTQILDQRERDEPVPSSVNIFHPGQEIRVWTTEISPFVGNAVAEKIIVYSDGEPEPCEPYWLKNTPVHP